MSLQELRTDPMMAHLMDSLEAGKDIGHYGRLVFVMVARHFAQDQELLQWLIRGRSFREDEARALIQQVKERGYTPPRRDRILQWQSRQDFPIIPQPHDPDCGNVYKNLKFPQEVYEHIEEYHEQKAEAQAEAVT